MILDFFMPTKLISGTDCVKGNRGEFDIGEKAIIVTGRSSAKKCGALDDVCETLDSLGIGYVVFDSVRENPLMSVCFDGGRFAFENGCDFVVGIGGGSPLDASKAIAAYAANNGIGAGEIFTAKLKPSLPIIAIPTTAGTGSEANPYSVLTLDGEDKKKTFKSVYSYPKTALLDPKYTYTLDRGYTVSTALDAFCHGFESFMSPKSTEISEMFALSAAKSIWEVFTQTDLDDITHETREKLMNASCKAGIAINRTGTGFPHPLGYNLTMFHGLPHGRACAVFIGEFVQYNSKNETGRERIKAFAEFLGTTPEKLSEVITTLADVSMKVSDSEIESFIEHTGKAGNYANSPYVISTDEMRAIYRKLFL